MALQGHIVHLSNQHKKIEDIIENEMSSPDWDEMRVAALKKQKLRIFFIIFGFYATIRH